MINHGQTDQAALQGPQNRVQRSVEWIATDPKTDRVGKAVVGIVRFDVSTLATTTKDPAITAWVQSNINRTEN